MRIFAFAMLIILAGCCEKNIQTSHSQSNNPWRLADDIYNNEITKKVFYQLNQEEQLHVCESGSDLRGMDKIKVMHCGFGYYYDIGVDEARRLILKAGDLYLKAINDNEKIRPFLLTHPFTPENIEIRIFLYNFDGSTPPPEKLWIISLIQGRVQYKKICVSDSRKFPETVCEETFEEAKAKLLCSNNANIHQDTKEPVAFPCPEIFTIEKGKLLPLEGKIINGRYHAPQGVFSCHADDFGEGEHIAQDTLLEHSAYAGFYSSEGNFKRVEVAFIPMLGEKVVNKNALQKAIENTPLILKTVEHPQGVKNVHEEMIDDMLFEVISIEKLPSLKTPNGEYMPTTRGHLVFKEKDKLVMLTNQIVTLPGQEHTPKQHIEILKQDILKFRKTFEFGPIPVSASREKKEQK